MSIPEPQALIVLPELLNLLFLFDARVTAVGHIYALSICMQVGWCLPYYLGI